MERAEADTDGRSVRRVGIPVALEPDDPEAIETLTFRALDRERFEALVLDHPPSKEEVDRHREAGLPPPRWGANDFFPALLAAASESPALTLDQAQEIYDEWSHGEVSTLVDAVLNLCASQRVAEISERLWRDERLRLELSYCVPLGIPHSTFLSWPESDQDKAIAYTLAKAEVCPNCGTRSQDWQGEDRRLHDPPLYEPVAVRCYGCAEMERMRETVPPNQRGVYVVIRPYGEVPDPNAPPQ